MRKKAKQKPRVRNKNLALVARFTIYGYGYVKQVACGVRENELISRAIKAANNDDLETLLTIQKERETKLNIQITG